MNQAEGEFTNLHSSLGFVRPSPEALKALSGNLEGTIRSYLVVLLEKPTNLRVVSLYFWYVLLSKNLDQEFTVNYAALSQQFGVSSDHIRRVVTDAVQSGYLRMVVVGNRSKPTLYAINWREATATTE